MAMRYFTSDTHFGHAGIIGFCDRPFSSVDEMNEGMIDRWNSVVGPDDIVFHLGDVAMGKIADTLPLVGRLNGHKYLVPGNHDRVFRANKKSYVERFTEVYEGVFNGGVLAHEFDLELANGTVVKLSHFPYHGDHFAEDRYPEYRPKDDGKVLIHGHIHEMWKVNGNQINVGVDVNDFRPVSEDELIDTIMTLD